MTGPVLAIDDLHVWFRTGSTRHDAAESHTLKGISLSVAPGERVGLVGESGCGKTTTILAAMGLLPSSASVAGRILLDGEDLLARGEKSLAPHRWTDLAMVFQGAMNAFNPVHTVGWQLAEALRIHRPAPREAIARRVRELLGMVGIPANRADAYPHEFSGGMRQRAVIAMALACEPRVLLADEPTTALDVVIQDQILTLLSSLCDELALALVLVTHDLAVVAQTCDRAVVMLDGEIVEQGPVLELYRNPSHPYTRRLFEATPSLADVRTSESTTPTATAPLLDVRELQVAYPGRRSVADALRRRPAPQQLAVDGISLTVDRGEMVALVGQSGCGKTSTVQSVLGIVPAAGGQILLDGQPTANLDRGALRQLRRRVQMIYQDPYESLDGRFRVRDTLEEPLRIHRVAADRDQRRAIVRDALDRVGLTPPSRYLNRYPHELSGGQRQRVSIAACLVLQPELLLADEPVSMLDVSLRTGILDLLDELRADGSLGILMITHDLSTAATYADRILVMHQGRLVEQGPAWQVVNEPADAYTQALLAAVPSPDPGARVSAAAARPAPA
jgi:peptide/nickel transport system ATP-binding protein